jgi:hypothetical protein
MTTAKTLNPDGNRLHAFLHAPVGTDDRGAELSLLSALARLGLDPWEEAGHLTTMGRGRAAERVEGWLAQLTGIAAPSKDRAAVARRLVALLPGPGVAPIRSRMACHIIRAPVLNPGPLLAATILLAFILPLIFGWGPDP